MILPDVNVLVYAHRRDARDHDRYLEWLVAEVDSRFEGLKWHHPLPSGPA